MDHCFPQEEQLAKCRVHMKHENSCRRIPVSTPSCNRAIGPNTLMVKVLQNP